MTLLKELIHIPEQVQRGDFVLNLAAGLEQQAINQTLRDYVVTPELAVSFADALNFIQSAVASGQARSKGAYLHGSFGSGKSHFMAVLNLLLQGNPQARAIPELAGAVSKHDDWLQSRNILLVPYHMIGSASLEDGVLSGYARHIAKLHPDARVPGFYMSEELFKDARNLRERIGDESFFTALNGDADDDGWGDVSGHWDAPAFESVLRGEAGDDHARLVSDLVSTHFQGYRRMGEYINFDEALGVMTQHAKDLGYDAIVLFLDELILWLASRLADTQFITAEVQKVVKLVETGTSRALPLVSFIARQRDLREFVGDQMDGAQQTALSDSLKYWDGRFHTITLEDRNLAVIAERRLLVPVNDGARDQLDQAFEETRQMREEAFEILLTAHANRDMFRQMYPFSPALVEALIALSSALQRERTALKVMLMLLVEQRDTLELGTLIPVGDLYDVIATEAEPFSESMRQHFDNARRLFERKLIPLLEQEHGVAREALSGLAPDDAALRAFTNDLRLLKTLLLAALVPQVPCFQNLTATKLAALNHGTIRSRIPGQESQAVLQRCRKWAGQVGEIKVGDDTNPLIGIQLSGVDTESIIDAARINDNEGNRKRLVKELVYEAFGIAEQNTMFEEHEFIWRGSRRVVEVLFENIREISDARTFEPHSRDWRIIIDFPFDVGNHSPMSDQARVQEYQKNDGQARTICWLPYFFSDVMRQNLGKLVVLQEILKSSDSYNRYSDHLTPQDRASAKTLLDNQRSQLRHQLTQCLLGAYGVAAPHPGTLDDASTLQSQVISLQPGFSPRLPQGATMRDAFEQLLGQAFLSQYPGHPEFTSEVKLADLSKVLPELQRALHATDHRIDVDRPNRVLLQRIAAPLGLGTMYERHFVLDAEWTRSLEQAVAGYDGELTVAVLRAAMDEPQPRGLVPMLQNLLILLLAEFRQYAFTRQGGPFSNVQLREVPDDLVLVKQALVAADDWSKAIKNAGAVFGLTVRNLLTANNQNDLARTAQATAAGCVEHCGILVSLLEKHATALQVVGDCDRLQTARAAVELVEHLREIDPGPDTIERLAAVAAPTSVHALGRSIKTAQEVAAALQNNNWSLMESLCSNGTSGADEVRQRLALAFAADELVTPLPEALRTSQRELTDLVKAAPRVDTPAQSTAPITPPQPGRRIVKQTQRRGLTAADAREVIQELEAALKEGVAVDIAFTITESDGDDA